MKRAILVFSSFLLLVVFLTSCSSGSSQVYSHLSDQQLVAEDNSSKTNYEHLNDNLCSLKPHCCDIFTKNETRFRSLELEAISTRNPSLCSELPETPLVVDDCPQKDRFVYYNKSRCLEQSTR
ncbi:MAG: hypothetical protein ACQESC_01990 [Nanobdellota archaeon]